jgi:Lar family restriction alleviation protein
MESDTIELKNCPFCGGGDVGVFQTFYPGGWVVACDDCHTETGQLNTREEAVRFWNHREDEKVSELLGMLEIERSFGLSIGVIRLVQELLTEYKPKFDK